MTLLRICLSLSGSDVNERGRWATLLPDEPVKTPRLAADDGKPGTAVGVPEAFEAMTTHSTLPDSVTQANYWLGRARQQLGDDKGARAAWEEAATKLGEMEK